jgi:hypothetical protein
VFFAVVGPDEVTTSRYSVSCPEGQTAIAGGVRLAGEGTARYSIRESFQDPEDPRTWLVSFLVSYPTPGFGSGASGWLYATCVATV